MEVDNPAESGKQPVGPPIVTIAIPTYNRVDLLRVVVTAVQAQTHPRLVVIISDNASSDGTEGFARGLAITDSRVRYQRHPENLGPTANFVAALGAASGDHFMWLADDDWIPPDYVEQCVAALEADPSLALAAGIPSYYVDGTLDHEGVRIDLLGDDPVDRVLDYYRQVLDNGTFYGVMPLRFLRRTSLRARMGGDWLLLAELAALGKIRTIPTTEIRRELAVGYSFHRMATSGGLSRFEGRFPYVAIAALAAWVPVSGAPAYRGLGARRFPLAVRSAAVIFRRFVLTGLRWRSLKRRMTSIASRRPAMAPGKDARTNEPDR
jgi:glycosyltransferase involved in cell wall biosynthesis